MKDAFISILMLTYNAPEYVEISIRSVKSLTNDVDYELIILDNSSEAETRQLLDKLDKEGLIDKLILLDRNSLFAEGNNIAASNASDKVTHFLLLNSDIKINSASWLRNLLQLHKRGITSYGMAPDPDRADGYCLLIDADIYKELQLDTSHQWWWSVTKLQAQVLNAGHRVLAFSEHEKYLHHFGGKSGSGFKNAKGMNVSKEEVLSWFNGKKPEIIFPKPTIFSFAENVIRKLKSLVTV